MIPMGGAETGGAGLKGKHLRTDQRGVPKRNSSAVMVDAAAVLSRQFNEQLTQLAGLLAPLQETLRSEFRRKLRRPEYTEEHRQSLEALTLGAVAEVYAAGGGLEDFLEQVEYRGRRLAKLGLSPAAVVGALQEYDRVLAGRLPEALRRAVPMLEWIRNQLRFLIVVTLNNAFYQVREAESHAFYELFRVEVESRSLDELILRMLEVLANYTGADASRFYLLDEKAKAWRLAASLPESAGAGPGICTKTQLRKLSHPFCGPLQGKGKLPQDVHLDRGWLERYQTCWSLPMTGEGELRGVMQFAFEKAYTWLPREQELLMAAAERCWLATEKAQLVHHLGEREEQVRRLAQHMVEVEESERKRISRELHDEAGQSLLCVRLQMEMLERDVPDMPAPVKARLAETKDLVEHTIVEIRRLIGDLSPAVLDQMGLAAALRQLVNRFRRLHPSTAVRISLPRRLELPKRVEIIVYRLAQEVFNNIGKYSLARNVNLFMDSADGVLRMRVEDDGVGFDVAEAFSRRDTFGLSGMRERVALLGGTLAVRSLRRPRVSGAEAQGVLGEGEPAELQDGLVGVTRPGTAVWIDLPLEQPQRLPRKRVQPAARSRGYRKAASRGSQRRV